MLCVYPYGLQLPAGRRWQGLVTALTGEGAGQLRQRNNGAIGAIEGRWAVRRRLGMGWLAACSMTGAHMTAPGQGWS